MAYSDKVIDHYENPRNVGSFEKGDDRVGTGMVGAPACGDVMKLQIKVNEQGVIEDARFKTYGCGSAIASSSLVNDAGNYPFVRQGRTYSASDMIALQQAWVADFPIISIEDGLGEDDWCNWPAMTAALSKIQLVGDDLFATQPARIDRAIAAGICNAALIKVNQNGTVSGTLDAIRSARAGGYATVISARSGETEDDFLADLAVGVAGGQIKIGSVRNSERLSKYNQLLRLEEEGLDWSSASGIAPL